MSALQIAYSRCRLIPNIVRVRHTLRRANSCRWNSTATATSAKVSLVDFDCSNHRSPTWSLTQYKFANSASLNNHPTTNATNANSPITREELLHLANLSYLPYPNDDTKLLNDVTSVIGWFDSITSLDVASHEPMYTPLEVLEYYAPISSPSGSPLTEVPSTRLRSDEVVDGAIEKKLLNNAPFAGRGFFVVPKSGKNAEMEES